MGRGRDTKNKNQLLHRKCQDRDGWIDGWMLKQKHNADFPTLANKYRARKHDHDSSGREQPKRGWIGRDHLY